MSHHIYRENMSAKELELLERVVRDAGGKENAKWTTVAQKVSKLAQAKNLYPSRYHYRTKAFVEQEFLRKLDGSVRGRGLQGPQHSTAWDITASQLREYGLDRFQELPREQLLKVVEEISETGVLSEKIELAPRERERSEEPALPPVDLRPYTEAELANFAMAEARGKKRPAPEDTRPSKRPKSNASNQRLTNRQAAEILSLLSGHKTP